MQKLTVTKKSFEIITFSNFVLKMLMTLWKFFRIYFLPDIIFEPFYFKFPKFPLSFLFTKLKKEKIKS